MKKLILLVLITVSLNLFSQTYANRIKNDTVIHKNIFPFFAKNVRDKGYDLPLSAGIGVNYVWQKSYIFVGNVNIGFNGGEQYNVDELIRFNSTSTESRGFNIRPDIWVLPFLNVYGVFARSKTQNKIDLSVYIPRLNDGEELFNINTAPMLDATTTGFGIIPTIGVWGVWIALDMNFTWTDVSTLKKPVYTFIFDPRIGKTFTFRNPKRAISVWVGGFRLDISRDTDGNIAFSEVFNIDNLNSQVDAGKVKVEGAQIELDDWWDGLTPIEQKNPVNITKKTANQKKLNLAGTVLDAAGNIVDKADESTIQYTLDKEPVNMWNFVTGVQFELNKNIQFRVEGGYLGSRNHVIGSIQYRFAL